MPELHTHTNNKISLIHQPSKDMVKVIQNDISTTTVELPAEVQAGLKPGRSTIEQILNVTSKQDRITTKYTLFMNKVERQYGVKGYESDVKINLEKVEIVIKGNINFRDSTYIMSLFKCSNFLNQIQLENLNFDGMWEFIDTITIFMFNYLLIFDDLTWCYSCRSRTASYLVLCEFTTSPILRLASCITAVTIIHISRQESVRLAEMQFYW